MGQKPWRVWVLTLAVAPLGGCFLLGEAALEGICGAAGCGPGWGFSVPEDTSSTSSSSSTGGNGSGASSTGGSTSGGSTSGNASGGASSSGVVASSSVASGGASSGNSGVASSSAASSSGAVSSSVGGSSGVASSTSVASSGVSGASSLGMSSSGASSSSGPCGVCSGQGEICWAGQCRLLEHYSSGTADWESTVNPGFESTKWFFVGGSGETGRLTFHFVVPMSNNTGRLVTTGLAWQDTVTNVDDMFGGDTLANGGATGAALDDLQQLTTAWAGSQTLRLVQNTTTSAIRAFRWYLPGSGAQMTRGADDAGLDTGDIGPMVGESVLDYSVVLGDLSASATRAAVLTTEDSDAVRLYVTDNDNTATTPIVVVPSHFTDPSQVMAVAGGGAVSAVVYKHSAAGEWHGMDGTAGGTFSSLSLMGMLPPIPAQHTAPHRPFTLVSAAGGQPMLIALVRTASDGTCPNNYRPRFYTFSTPPIPVEHVVPNAPCLPVTGPVSWQVVPALPPENRAYAMLITTTHVLVFEIQAGSGGSGFPANAVSEALDLSATHPAPVGLGLLQTVTGKPPVVCTTRSEGLTANNTETVTCDRVRLRP